MKSFRRTRSRESAAEEVDSEMEPESREEEEEPDGRLGEAL